MTRIFEALKKGRVAEPSSPFASPAAPLLPVPGGRAAARAPGEMGTSAARAERAMPRIEMAEAPPLPEEIAREMVAIRLGLESALKDHPTRVIMFASSVRREGATTVASQFASLLARNEQARTLLVDFNGRRPAIAARFGLAGQRPSGPSSLAICAPAPDHPGAVPPPAAAREFLAEVSGRYDWVVVDGPPVLEAPESADLAAVVDGVVIVVRSGHTKRPVVARAAGLLRKSGARILGTVLNRRRLEIPDFIYRRI